MIAAFFVFVLGTCLGSFSSALLYRTRTGDSVARGRSACPSCRHVLGVLDLVPIVSWIALRGRCRHCRARVSWQYLALEAGSGALFLAAYMSAGAPSMMYASPAWLAFLRLASFSVFLILVFAYDARYGEIPDSYSITGAVFALGVNIALEPSRWYWYLAACAAGAAFFGIQYLASRGRWVGDGDIFLGAMLGAMLGWPWIFYGIFSGYFVGLLAVAVLLAVRRKGLTDSIPLGPFLTIGTAAILLMPAETLLRIPYAFYF